MTVSENEHESIKKAVAIRAREFGDRVSPNEVTLVFMDTDAIPGYRVFHAWWGAGEAQNWLSGLIINDEAPDTYPAQALGKIFHRWMETEGKLPDARLAANVSAYLYDASGQHRVILNEEDKARFIRRPEWQAQVRLPELIEVAGQPGVAFWWINSVGASRMQVYLAGRGKIRTEETFVGEIRR